MKESILAVVVSFNPHCEPLKLSLRELERQGCDCTIIDNGSANLSEIESLVAGLNSTSLLSQKQNLGLGAAHNIGIKFAANKNYDYVLLLDQDSHVLDNMVANLAKAHQAKSLNNQVSAVGATYLNNDNGSESFFIRFGALKFSRYYCHDKDSDGCIEADFLISSGSLLSIEAIESIGQMDETLFIDHVDTEWFLRAKSKGFKAYGVCDARMQHGLGEETHVVSFAGRQRNVPQHNAFRYYYIFRNSVLLYKRAYANNLWKWNDVQRLAMIAIMFGALKAPRLKNASMMCKGLIDGIRGINGPMKDSSNDQPLNQHD